MQSRPLHPTDEASLDSILASAGRNRSDFIDLNPELGHGRLLHRRLPPPGGMAHFHVSDDLDILLEFTDAEWPRICAAVGGDPPDGVEPVGSYQQPLITELTTPLVSFQDTGLRRRFENHPVVACHCIDGNARYPDWVWVHYILRINQLTWAEVLLCHDRNDNPNEIDEAYADDGDFGRPYVGKWSGWYLEAPGVLKWYVDHQQTPPADLLVDLLDHALSFASRPSRQGAVPGHGPEPEERSGVKANDWGAKLSETVGNASPHKVLITLTKLAKVTGKDRKWFENRTKKWPEPVVKSHRGKGRSPSEWSVDDILPIIEEENKVVAGKIKAWLQSQDRS